MPAPEDHLDLLLPGFVEQWVREATGRAGGEDQAPRPALYVDAFAGAEWTFGIGRSRPADTSRAAGAAVAAAGAGAAVLLVEEDPALLARIHADLERRGHPAASAGDAADPVQGEIRLVEADFPSLVDQVAAQSPAMRLLVWAAPPSARRLPWTVAAGLLEDPDAELLLRFPAEDFVKQARFNSPLADLPSFARRMVEGCSAFLGDPRHGWLSAWRATADGCVALADVTGAYAERVAAAAGARIAKQSGVSEDRLLLLTAAPEVALALNGVVAEAAAAEPPSSRGNGDALDLFGAPPVAPRAADPAAELAERLARAHRGQTLTLRQLVAETAATTATLDHLRRALASLRRSGVVVYRSLRHPEAAITFVDHPQPAARPARTRRASGCGDLFSMV